MTVRIRRSSNRLRRRLLLAVGLALLIVTSFAMVLPPDQQASAAVPTGFSELTAFNGLAQPTAVRFAPDGRVFVAEKRGTIKMFDGLGDTTAVQVADLRTEVHNFWDRGLLGLAIDPGFPARPYLYALYTFDGPVGGVAPRWGAEGVDSDPCPNPPGGTGDGCVVSGKLVRLTLNGTSTTKQDLVHDWCQQYPSHSTGDVVFGRDGSLYASGGDGASFDWVDYGQDDNPVNPCDDPPGGAGAALTPPTAEGGALRSQDLRTSGDSVTLDGTVIRVDPDTGLALPDNPNYAAADLNARRIVAYGLRNPFRMTTRPGTDEVWLGDVGWGSFEEVNRLQNPTGGLVNFGWPCFEGDGRQGGYDAANLNICENLYSQGGDTKPYYPYRHGQPLNTSDNCNTTRGSSSSGISFQFYSGGPYPAEYDGALFFSDYSRNCIWIMTKGADGLPDKVKVKPFVSGAAGPVDLELSPTGELFYVDLNGGTIRRIVYGSTGPSSCPAGQYLAEYFADKTLSTRAATACEAAPLDRDWGTGSPPGVGPDNFSARWTGRFDFPSASTYTFTAVTDDGIRVWVDGTLLIDEWRDQPATTFTGSRALSAGAHDVRVEWFETGGDAVAKLGWVSATTNNPPEPTIAAPAAGTTWKVGDTITFSGSATDAEDGALPASALSWSIILNHCPGEGCHAHPVQSWTGVSGASVAAPDHEYPSHLELRLTATDSTGQSKTVTRRLDPQTVTLTVASDPPGLLLALGQAAATAPITRTVIVGSTNSLSAPSPQTLSGATYSFNRWSDGGAQSHNVVAGATPTTYTASFTAGSGPPCGLGRYQAQYFANRTLSGSPATTACEDAPIARNWGNGGPAGVGSNNFSAWWTGTFTFAGGSTTFTGSADDGIRVWLDGTLVLDRWNASGSFSTTSSVAPGDHVVRVEYFEKTNSASVNLRW